MIDRILTGGLVHTPAGDVSAVAIKDGRIAAVGGDDEIMLMAGENTEITPLFGACVAPGFIDSHCHLAGVGMDERRVNLYGARSVEEIIERGRAYIARVNPEKGRWIIARGFNHHDFADDRLPDRYAADAISTSHPVLIERVCGHIGALNECALALMNYHKGTVVPGGEIRKDADGNVNGIVCERALDAVLAAQPAPSVEDVQEILLSGIRAMNRFGITSVHSDDLMNGVTLNTLMAAVSALRAKGLFTLRLYEECQAPDMSALSSFLARGMRTGDGDEYFKIGNIKLLSDGSLGAHTAYLRAPYADAPASRGVNVYKQAELDALVKTAHDAGMQVAIHAIGDGALEMCIDAFERAQRGDTSLRHRVVHCQVAGDDQLARTAALRLNADVQPPFTATDEKMIRPLLGDARAGACYRWKTMRDMGISVSGGSDAPVESPNPIWGMACAVNRVDADGYPAGGWMPEEKLNARDALRLYTECGAYASFEEAEKGRIAPGMLADFAVLSASPLRVAPGAIKDIRVMRTIVGGRDAYSAK